MAKSNKSRYAILGMLALYPNSSGYDIKKRMEEETQYFWKETYSSIYPMLQELEKEGLILQLDPPSTNGRPRYIYCLSPQGKEVLKEWLAKPVEPDQPRNELLLKIFFGEAGQPSFNRKHLEAYQESLAHKQEIYRQIREQLLHEEQNSPSLPYWLLTLDFGLRQVQSAMDWCKEALKQMIKLEEDAVHAKKE